MKLDFKSARSEVRSTIEKAVKFRMDHGMRGCAIGGGVHLVPALTASALMRIRPPIFI